MMKPICIILFYLFLSVCVSAQLIQIDGNYLDKKNNPIDSATITYLQEGVNQLDTTLTDTLGNFNLEIYLTSIRNNLNGNHSLIGTPFPNPFQSSVSLHVHIKERTKLSVYDLQGKTVCQFEPAVPGSYLFQWGGLDMTGAPVPKGVYFFVAANDHEQAVRKLIFLGSGNTSVARLTESGNSHHQKSTLTQDIITFAKENTTYYELPLETPASDTSLGTIIGNAGPEILTLITDTITDEGVPLILNLNEYIYNDDQSVYTSTTPGVIFNEDSLLFFWIEQGIHPVEINITDPDDPQLTGTLSFTVTGMNAPPVLLNNIPDLQSDEDNQLSLDMPEYFYDYDQLAYTLENLTNGSYYISNDSLYLIPEENWNGVQTGLVIKADDGDDFIYSNEFSWTVEPVDDPPYQTNNIPLQTVNEDSELIIHLRPDYADDIDSPVLTYAVSGIQNATYNFNEDTLFIYPDQDWYGSISGIEIEVSDEEYSIMLNSFDITVLPVNDPPYATNPFENTYTVNEDETLEITVWNQHYHDIDNEILTYPINNLENATGEQTVTTVKIIPDDNWNGTITGVEVDAYDGDLTATNNPFNVEVISINDYPNIIDDVANTPYYTSVTIDVLANDNDDLDPDGGIDPSTLSIITQPAPEEGVAEVVGGQIEFTPTLGFNGQITFVYEVYDNGVPAPALSGQATVVVNVEAGNLPPTLNLPDTINAQEDQSVPAELLNLLNSYSDPEGQEGTFTITNQSNGTLANTQIQQDTLLFLTYLQPNGNGTSTITIEADDGENIVTDNTVLKVEAMNDAPFTTGAFDNYNIIQGDSVVVENVKPDKFDDVDVGDFLTYLVNGLGSNGTAYQIGETTLVIKPNADFYGDLLNLSTKATDILGLFVTSGTFSIYVQPSNQAPIAQDDNASTDQDEAVSIDVLANDFDPDGNLLPSSVEIVESPSNGQITNINSTTGVITYNPTSTWFGTDNFKYRVADDGDPQYWDTATVTVDVNQVLGEVFFSIRDITTDQPMPGSTLIIGTNQYILPTGETSIQVNPQTVQVNAEATGTWDGLQWWNAPHYTIIQRPGQLANVEQRAGGLNGGDASSPVTFSGNADTLIIYKIPSTVNLSEVSLATMAGPGGQTVKYLEENFTSPIWFNTAPPNVTPNATTIERVNYLRNDLLPEATMGKYNLDLIVSSTSPGGVLCEAIINSNYSPTNATTWNSNFEVIYSHAAWPGNFDFETIGTEIIEALFGMDSTVPYFEYDYGTSAWGFSDFGRDCVRLASNFDRGTIIAFSASDKINIKNYARKIKRFERRAERKAEKQDEYFSKPSIDNNLDVNYISK